MNSKAMTTQLPRSQTLIRTSAYCAVIVLLFPSFATSAGVIAAVLAVPLGVAIAHIGIQYRLRTIAILSVALLSLAVGFAANNWIGGSSSLARLIGPILLLCVTDAVSLGLMTFGVVLVLQSLTLRGRVFAILEIALLGMIVVIAFAGHRHGNIGQPRQFAEWAVSNGLDPRWVLRVIGSGFSATALLLLIRTRNHKQAWTSIAILVVVIFVAFQASLVLVPDRQPTGGTASNVSQSPSELGKKGDLNPPQSEFSAGKTASPGSIIDGQQDRDEMSFAPQEWPNFATPMAIVTLRDDLPPGMRSQLYFRQQAFSQFNGRTLVRSVGVELDNDVPRLFPVHDILLQGSNLDDQIQWHRVPAMISLIRPHVRPFALTNPTALRPQVNLDPTSFERTYETESVVIPHSLLSHEFLARQTGDTRWSADQRQYYLEGPDDPRYRHLAELILGEVDFTKISEPYRESDVVKAVCIRRWIERNMVYYLNADHSRQSDPVASFLFGDRRGYCVHVAYAMTYLLRSIGIPSRVASGYTTDAGRSGKGSAILLVSTDLHAWCEIYIDGLGWQPIDASLERSESPPPPPVDSALQQFYGQRNRLSEKRAQVGAYAGTLSRSLSAVIVLLSISLLCVYALKFYRLVTPYLWQRDHLYRTCYRAAADRLAEVGLYRRSGETREEFAERILETVPEFYRLTAMHVRQAVTGENICSREEWIMALRGVSARIRTTYSSSHRLRGRLDPLSWLKVI
ncbi:MAG TPA: transglutaminase domain-containing protein [Pirellulaceae bacterium]|nr:transglutaminase domain-containing protein [Pirellulaceae bacterium]HMO93934.1 transglutaminase domain-containing protein [Pirellulaceae bacterium]HMP69755.1 transglutaminase domain-containing protein [Pirellulaceae bacterium]